MVRKSKTKTKTARVMTAKEQLALASQRSMQRAVNAERKTTQLTRQLGKLRQVFNITLERARHEILDC